MIMKDLIVEAWANRELLKDNKYSDAVKAVIEEVDRGETSHIAVLRHSTNANMGCCTV